MFVGMSDMGEEWIQLWGELEGATKAKLLRNQ